MYYSSVDTGPLLVVVVAVDGDAVEATAGDVVAVVWGPGDRPGPKSGNQANKTKWGPPLITQRPTGARLGHSVRFSTVPPSLRFSSSSVVKRWFVSFLKKTKHLLFLLRFWRYLIL